MKKGMRSFFVLDLFVALIVAYDQGYLLSIYPFSLGKLVS